MRRQDWLLLVLNAADGAKMSPAQVQKTVFLVGRRRPVGDDFYEFKPDAYGPFCIDIVHDAQRLDDQGFARVVHDRRHINPDYCVTVKGHRRALELEETLDVESRDYVHKIVEWAMQLDFKGLVASVNAAYPEFAVNSVFRSRQDPEAKPDRDPTHAAT